jgi:hypothetical protein
MYCVRWSSFATNAIFSGSAINPCSGAIRFCNVCSWLETRSIVSPIWVTGKWGHWAVSAMKPYMQDIRILLLFYLRPCCFGMVVKNPISFWQLSSRRVKRSVDLIWFFNLNCNAFCYKSP